MVCRVLSRSIEAVLRIRFFSFDDDSDEMEECYEGSQWSGFDGKSMMFQLTVTGADGSRAQDKCIVNVTNGNTPLVADAGPNQTVVSGQQVELDGSGSYDAEDGRRESHGQEQSGCYN